MANLHLNFRSDMLMRSVYPRVFLPDYNDWNDVTPLCEFLTAKGGK